MTRPDESEYTPFAKGYVEGVEGTDIVGVLETQKTAFVSLAKTLDGLHRYEPGKWSVNEVVGHMNDTERVFAYRTLCVGRGDQSLFPGFGQDDYLATADFNRRTLSDLIEEFALIRESSIRLLRYMPEPAWLRRGTVAGYSVTTRGLAFTLAGHEFHHFKILRDRYRSCELNPLPFGPK